MLRLAIVLKYPVIKEHFFRTVSTEKKKGGRRGAWKKVFSKTSFPQFLTEFIL